MVLQFSYGVNFKLRVMPNLWDLRLNRHIMDVVKHDIIFLSHWLAPLVCTCWLWWLFIEPPVKQPWISPFKLIPCLFWLVLFLLCFICHHTQVCFLSFRIVLIPLVYDWPSLIFCCYCGFTHIYTTLFSFQWCFIRARKHMNVLRPSSWTKRYQNQEKR